MQVKPAAREERVHPPAGPQIPLAAMQSLIPRLTTTINDIDSFRSLLEHGAQDGSMPNWETLLQRYALLLGRINALSTFLAQPSAPLPTASRFDVPRPPADPRPALDKFLVHPLNPLPFTAPSSAIEAQAADAFFQVINTQSLTSVSDAQADLVDRPESSWTSKTDLHKMSENELGTMILRLKGRLEREGRVADRVREMIEKHGEEYDWGMRVGGGGGEEDEGAERADNKPDEARGGVGNPVQVDEDDDLFGDDEDDAPVPASMMTEDPIHQKAAGPPPNPRAGWKVSDYVRYMNTGVEPGLPP